MILNLQVNAITFIIILNGCPKNATLCNYSLIPSRYIRTMKLAKHVSNKYNKYNRKCKSV